MADDLSAREALKRICFILARISEVVYDSPDALGSLTLQLLYRLIPISD